MQDHRYTPDRFPNHGLGSGLSSSHNYCRNPSGSEPGVWCFIKSGNAAGALRYQYCTNVPMCEDAAGVEPGPVEQGNATSMPRGPAGVPDRSGGAAAAAAPETAEATLVEKPTRANVVCTSRQRFILGVSSCFATFRRG
jgi:hypothetical protein